MSRFPSAPKLRRLPDGLLRRMRADWIASADPAAAIAARHGIHPATLRRHARERGWPPRGSDPGAAPPPGPAPPAYTRMTAARWRRIRDDWTTSLDPPKEIAARHGIAQKTLAQRAARDEWPEQGSLADDPLVVARLLHAELVTELRASLRALREGGEAPASADRRAPLIRAHRRALVALLDARKTLGPQARDTGAQAAPTVPALDLDAARREVLARLARLATTPPDAA